MEKRACPGYNDFGDCLTHYINYYLSFTFIFRLKSNEMKWNIEFSRFGGTFFQLGIRMKTYCRCIFWSLSSIYWVKRRVWHRRYVSILLRLENTRPRCWGVHVPISNNRVAYQESNCLCILFSFYKTTFPQNRIKIVYFMGYFVVWYNKTGIK